MLVLNVTCDVTIKLYYYIIYLLCKLNFLKCSLFEFVELDVLHVGAVLCLILHMFPFKV